MTTTPQLSTKEKTARERRNQIALVAIRLFLKQGIANTSMRQLALEVGMTTGGLYHFFRSKNEIIRMVAQNAKYYHGTVKMFRETLGEVSPTVAFRECARYWLTINKVSQEYAIFFDRETLHLEPSIRESFLEGVRGLIHYFEELINDGIKAGEFQVDNVTLVAFNVVMLRTQYAMRRWFLRDIMTPEEYAEQQVNAIMKQIAVVRGQPCAAVVPAAAVNQGEGKK